MADRERVRQGPRGRPAGGLAAPALPGPGGSSVTVAVITGVINNTFACRLLNAADGLPVGDPFTVHARSWPVVGGKIAQQELVDCDPKRIEGDLLEIENANVHVGGGEWISGRWAVERFTAWGCETSNCTEIP